MEAGRRVIGMGNVSFPALFADPRWTGRLSGPLRSVGALCGGIRDTGIYLLTQDIFWYASK